VAAETPTGLSYLAVQEDIAVTCVGWPSHAWTTGDHDFTRQITVLREPISRPVAISRWAGPTDGAADQTLARIGWHRIGPWHTDPLGRRTAPVTRDPPLSRHRN
jgi:hypothetical protein